MEKRQYGQIGKFKIMLVPGDRIRRDVDIEFTNFSQHYHSPYIPKGELWIDNAVDPGEIPFMAKSAAEEATLMGNGASYAKAEGVASKIETAARKNDPAQHARVIESMLGSNGHVSAYLVKGRAVRDKFDDEFTLGGHGRIYPWIPKHTIWLDDATKPDDRPFDFLHELYEWNEMGRGASYVKAHRAASKVEQYARNHQQVYRMLLQHEMARAGGSMGLEKIAEFRKLLK